VTGDISLMMVISVTRGVLRNYKKMMTSEKNISLSDVGAEKRVDFPCSV
jgi:hypothetical protein